MKAAVVTQTGVEIREVPAPVPGRNHVLVRVRACGLNRADLSVAAGHRHGAIGGPGTIVGMEFAGEVVEVGAEASAVKPGESVLIQGASSGVGLMALQIAKHMGTRPGIDLKLTGDRAARAGQERGVALQPCPPAWGRWRNLGDSHRFQCATCPKANSHAAFQAAAYLPH